MHRSDTLSSFYDPNTPCQIFEDDGVRDRRETFWHLTCVCEIARTRSVAQNAARDAYMQIDRSYAPIGHDVVIGSSEPGAETGWLL